MKYIDIYLRAQGLKTNIYDVVNKRSDYYIGSIKWYPSWRQYCFFPEQNTVYSSGCMDDISDYIKNLMLNRKKP